MVSLKLGFRKPQLWYNEAGIETGIGSDSLDQGNCNTHRFSFRCGYGLPYEET